MRAQLPRAAAVTVGALVASVAALALGGGSANASHTPPGSYRNPVPIVTPSGAVVETFADPHVIRAADGFYYAYGTSDPLRDDDRTGADLNFHKIPIARSSDLVHWTYVGDAFSANPAWLEPDSGVWAPHVVYDSAAELYYLYYGGVDPKTEVSGRECDSEPAIGVATSTSPTGPFTDSGRPVVYPRPNGPGCDFFWTYDPATIEDDAGDRYIFFGSYYGGIFARRLSTDGMTSDPESEERITIPNRYEGSFIVRRGGFYYFFGSATDCCRGPLTGYSVFAGRSEDPLGPYVDRQGVPLTDGRVGGTPVISMNGNRWVGPGHNSVITDALGQDWFVYHAIDRGDPYLDRDPADPADPDPFNINRRPMLIDRLDWVGGWPTVRGGWWASDTLQHAPATGPGQGQPGVQPRPPDVPTMLLDGPSDEFDGALEPQWAWVRPPADGDTSLSERPGYFRFRTQNADLFEDSNNASVLTAPAPAGDFVVEVKFDFDVPPEGCCFNFEQAGIALLQDDDRFVKNAHVAIWETRQAEWAKEVPVGHPEQARPRRYGNTVLGPPATPEDVSPASTWLRIVKRTTASGAQHYTGYSSIDGIAWVRGGTWTHELSDLKIGLFSMGNGGPADDAAERHVADFDYVRVYAVAPLPAEPTFTPPPPAPPQPPAPPPPPPTPPAAPPAAPPAPPPAAPQPPAAVRDTTPPQTRIRSGPRGRTRARLARFTFSASERATFQCSRDGSPFRACRSPRRFTGFGVGFHVVRIRAIDTAGNIDPSPSVRVWRVLAKPKPKAKRPRR